MAGWVFDTTAIIKWRVRVIWDNIGASFESTKFLAGKRIPRFWRVGGFLAVSPAKKKLKTNETWKKWSFLSIAPVTQFRGGAAATIVSRHGRKRRWSKRIFGWTRRTRRSNCYVKLRNRRETCEEMNFNQEKCMAGTNYKLTSDNQGGNMHNATTHLVNFTDYSKQWCVNHELLLITRKSIFFAKQSCKICVTWKMHSNATNKLNFY